MSRRYRTDHQKDEERSTSSSITLMDFMFYNKQKSVVDKEVVDNIVQRLKDNKNEIIYWTNDIFLKQDFIFKFFNYKPRNYDKDVTEEPMIEIINKRPYTKATVEEVLNCKLIVNGIWFLAFYPTDKQYTYLSDMNKDKLDISMIRELPVFGSWEQVVESLVTHNLLDFDYEDFGPYQTDIEALLGIKVKDIDYDIISQHNGLSFGVELRHIFHVDERRYGDHNYRIYLSTKPERYYKYYHATVVRDDDIYYNYIDNDRIFLKVKNGDRSLNYYLDNGLTPTVGKKISLNMDLFGLIARNVISIIGTDRHVITPQIFRFYSARFGSIEIGNYGYSSRSDEEREAESKIVAKYTKVLREGKEVHMNGLIVTNTKIEVQDTDFVIRFNRNFFNAREHIGTLRRLASSEDVRYNFNALFEKILELSALRIITRENTRTEDYKDFSKAVFLVNEMKIVVLKDTNNRWYINGEFCRIEDIFQILSRAICYNNIDDYKAYIADVSHIGHEWKKLIGTGVQLELSNPFNDVMRRIGQRVMDNIHLRFSFVWDIKSRTKIYLMVNGNRYLIKKKNVFRHRFNLPRVTVSMRQLKNYLTLSIPELTDDQIVEIVEDGIKEGELIKQKAAELVAKTVADIGATKTEILIAGAKKIGYVLKGRLTGSEYFIDANDLSVFKNSGGHWNRRCVVNDHNKNRIFEDWLANRLVNIYNEPAKIHTLHNV